MLGTPSNPQSSGRFWIDPATGAIHQTELWVQSDTDTARIQIVYAPDAKLGMLLPREATQTFESRERSAGLNSMSSSAAQSKLSFESTAKYSNATYVAIDLSRVVR